MHTSCEVQRLMIFTKNKAVYDGVQFSFGYIIPFWVALNPESCSRDNQFMFTTLSITRKKNNRKPVQACFDP